MKKILFCFFNITLCAGLLFNSVLSAPAFFNEVESAYEEDVVVKYNMDMNVMSETYTDFSGISYELYDYGSKLRISGTGKIEKLPEQLNLTTVNTLVVENGISAIGDYVFFGMSRLHSITLPDSLVYVGEKAFDGTKYVSDKKDGAVYIGNVLYTYKGEIQKDGAFVIQDGTKAIAHGALLARTEITDVSIPDSVVTIGNNAFYGCTSLEKVTFGTGLEYVGADAFYDTPWLKSKEQSVVIGKTLYSYNGEDLSVNISDGVEYVSGNAFYENKSVVSVSIPNSVKYIGENAFYGCSSLEDITFGNGLLRVGKNALAGTKYFDNLRDGVVYASNIAVSVKGDMLPGAEIKIKEGTVAIEDGLFENNNNLFKLHIPESVIFIGKNALSGCLNLTVYAEPESYSWNYALENNIAVYSKQQAETVKDSGSAESYEWTLYYDGTLDIKGSGKVSAIPSKIDRLFVKSVVFSEKISEIGESAFEKCENLVSVKFSDNIKYVGKDAFLDTKWQKNADDGALYIGKALYLFKDDKTTQVEVVGGTVSITDGAFAQNTSISSVKLPASLLKIGDKAFFNCSNLQSVVAGDNVEYIGTDAFYGTKWYKDFSDGEIYLGKTLYAYKGDVDDNTTISVKENTVSISDGAFFGLYGLVGVNLPETLKTIGEEAFAFCDNLSDIVVPVGVELIGQDAFLGCDNVTLIVVRASVAHKYAKNNGINFEISGIVLGDVNEDGKVNIKDLILLCQYISGNTTLSESQKEVADVYTDDGQNGVITLNNNDISHLSKFLSGATVVLG